MVIKENILRLKEKIERASQKAGTSEVKLIAVTKTQASSAIEEAINCGIEIIGENKVQEACEKIPPIREKIKEFHFIGHLQSNKIKKLMELRPELIHTIDKISTARKLNNFLIEKNIIQEVLIQVNTSDEMSKFGIKPEETHNFVEEILSLSNIKVKGLMTIGLFSDNEELVRAGFSKLRTLYFELKDCFKDDLDFKYLSMGMTNDFEIAIEEGSNMVRIGTAIFGNRKS